MSSTVIVSIFLVSIFTIGATFDCPTPWGNHANVEDCTSYYRCMNGTAMLEKCFPGLEFSATIGQCSVPHVAKCTKPLTMEKRQAYVDDLKDDDEYVEPAETPDEDDKEKDHDEDDNDNDNDDQQSGDTEKEKDDDNDDEDGDDTEKDKGKETPIEPLTDVCDGRQDGLFAYKENCSKYIQCVHGKSVVRPCPPNLFWSSKKTRCEWPATSDCPKAADKV